MRHISRVLSVLWCVVLGSALLSGFALLNSDYNIGDVGAIIYDAHVQVTWQGEYGHEHCDVSAALGDALWAIPRWEVRHGAQESLPLTANLVFFSCMCTFLMLWGGFSNRSIIIACAACAVIAMQLTVGVTVYFGNWGPWMATAEYWLLIRYIGYGALGIAIPLVTMAVTAMFERWLSRTPTTTPTPALTA